MTAVPPSGLQGFLPRKRLRAASRAVFVLAFFAGSALASTERWEPYPPGVGGPWGGSVRALVSPGDPANLSDPLWNVLWAATGGGAYRSADGGATWEPRNEGLHSLDVTDICASPADPGRLIASTATRGVHLSNDGGDTWTRVPASATLSQEKFARVAVSPVDPQHLFAATFNTSTHILLESRDGGDTWTRVAGAEASYAVSRMRFTHDGAYLYFSTKNGRIFRYNFAGNPAALPAFPGSPSAEIVDFALPGGDGSLIAAAQGGVGLWVSLNGGSTWTERHFAGAGNPEFHEVDAVGWDPLDPGRLLYRLNDPLAGAATALYELPLVGTRTSLPLPEQGMELQGIFVSPAAEWLLEAKAGLFRRTGRAGGFAHSSRGLAAYTARDVAFAPGSAGLAVAGGASGSGNGGAYRWEPQTAQWLRFAARPGDPPGNMFPAASTLLVRYQGADLWLGVDGWGLYRTRDGGQSWEDRNFGLGTQAKRGITGLEFFPETPQRAIAGTQAGVYSSSDAGASWSAAPEIPPTIGWATARDDGSPPGVVVAGKQGNDGLVLRSFDQGQTWMFAVDPAQGGGWLAPLPISCPDALPVDTARFAQWVKSPGQWFSADEALARIELEIPLSLAAPASGTVGAWRKAPGDIFLAGETLVEMQTVDGLLPVSSPGPGILLEIYLPAGSFGIAGGILGSFKELFDIQLHGSQSATVRQWFVSVGSVFGAGDLLARLELNSSAGTFIDIVADQVGRLRYRAPVGTSVSPGSAVGLFAALVDVAAPEAGRMLVTHRDVGSVVNTGDLLGRYTTFNAFQGVQLRLLAASSAVGGRLLAGAQQWFGLFETRDGGGSWTPLGGDESGLPGLGSVDAAAIGDQTDAPWMAAVVNRSVYLSLDGGASWAQRDEGLALPDGAMNLIYALRFEPGTSRLVAAVDGRGLWYLDLFPRAELSGVPPALTASRSATVQVGGGEIVGYRWSLDGAAYSGETAVSQAISLSGLPDGAHRLAVIGRSSSGLWQPAEVATAAQWTVDATPPTGGIAIAGGAAATPSVSVTLDLPASDGAGSGVTHMRVANGAPPTGTWSDYQASRSWVLPPGDGEKVVYAQLRDAAGNVSAVASDTILLDAAPPSGTVAINGGAAAATSASVTLDLSASDGAGSGVTHMRVANGASPAAAEWVSYAATLAWVLPPGDGEKTVSAQFRDAAGNVSAVASDTILLDAAPPSGTVAINGGAAAATSASVTLDLSASDGAGSGVTHMRVANGASPAAAEWVSYAATLAWVLPPGDGEKTVSAQFRDAAGNVSAVASHTIVLDTTPPSVTAAPGADTYTGPQAVVLTANEPATIYYTMDGSTPTTASASGPSPVTVTVSQSATLRYFGVDAAGNAGVVDSQTYVIQTLPPPDTTPPQVTVANPGGQYAGQVTVTLSVNEAASIYYTLDGTEPTTQSDIYAGPLVIAESVVLKYIAVDAAGNASSVYSQTYTITPAGGGGGGGGGGGCFLSALDE